VMVLDWLSGQFEVVALLIPSLYYALSLIWWQHNKATSRTLTVTLGRDLFSS